MQKIAESPELQQQARTIIEQELARIGFGGSVFYWEPSPSLQYHPDGVFEVESDKIITEYKDPPIVDLEQAVRDQLNISVAITGVPRGTDVTDWSPYSDAG